MARASRKKSSLLRIAVIVSGYNASVTNRLKTGALAAIRKRKAAATVIDAPGAFELPALALTAAQTWHFDGVVALGCLIKGETRHDRYIAEAVAHGLIHVTVRTGVPCAFGVVTADTPAQAAARAGGAKGNKGQEAADAVLDTVLAIKKITAAVGMNDDWSNGPIASRRLPDKTKVGKGGQGSRSGPNRMEDVPF